METFRKTQSGNTGISLSERLKRLEESSKYGAMKEESAKEQEQVKFPFKWRSNMQKANKKIAKDKVLVFYLNIKGEIEPPVLVPLYSGNIVIYKSKAYDFDPRALWTMKLKKSMIKALLIKEIDRRPVSNLDWDEIKKRGDSTDSDEILVKMVTKALVEKQKKELNKGIIAVIVIVIIVAVVFFLIKK